jgi:flagellar protein export ATPase FliI
MEETELIDESLLNPSLDVNKYFDLLDQASPVEVRGRVTEVTGLVMKAYVPGARIGDLCLINSPYQKAPVAAEVVGFREGQVFLMPLGDMEGIGLDSEVVNTNRPLSVKVGPELLGRILNGLGQPIDNKGKLPEGMKEYSVMATPPDPLQRKRILTHISVGVNAIDGLLTVGEGQRIGLFAAAGVGKSTLLGMIARNTEAQVNIISLIGERGREVRDFLEKDLGEDGLKRSVIVCATSDNSSLVRLKSAYVATAMAEYFRDQGLKVMLMMDSVTRFARAQREIGLAIGEPPARQGYTPSVFSTLPKLLERTGNSDKGSITAFYTVLVAGDDMNEPVADEVRSILDGHIILSRKLASSGHYPAIDISLSVSRVMDTVVTKEHRKTANQLREVLATYEKERDLIVIGAYQKGSDPRVDYAINKIDKVNDFLKQDLYSKIPFEDVEKQLVELFKDQKN